MSNVNQQRGTNTIVPFDEKPEIKLYRATIRANWPSLLKACQNDQKYLVALATDVSLLLRSNPALQRCNMESLYLAMCAAAMLKLRLGGAFQQAALVPYNGTVTFQPMVAGYRELAYRTGMVSELYSEVVYKGDVFDHSLGLHRDLVHRRTEQTQYRDEDITHAYAIIKFRDGSFDFRVMTRAEIEKRRDVSKQKADSPWVHWYPEKCKTTVVKALCKSLPWATDDMRTAMYASDSPENVREVAKRALETPAAITPDNVLDYIGSVVDDQKHTPEAEETSDEPEDPTEPLPVASPNGAASKFRRATTAAAPATNTPPPKPEPTPQASPPPPPQVSTRTTAGETHATHDMFSDEDQEFHQAKLITEEVNGWSQDERVEFYKRVKMFMEADDEDHTRQQAIIAVYRSYKQG